MKKIILECNGFILKVHISANNICILDSYRISSYKDMKNILLKLKEYEEASFIINKAGMFNMINEWRVHNLLHSFNIHTDRTKDVDLNIDNKWYIKAVYTILSPLYLNYF